MQPRRFFAVILMLWLGSPLLLAQTTIHVPADQPTIQAGINAANNGDTVLVAPGTYYENIDFSGKAITVMSLPGSSVNTIIDGSRKNAATVTFQSRETRSSILQGFTIQGGGSGGQLKALGGIYVLNSAPTIKVNHITNNYCQGIYSSASAPLIFDNVIDSTLDAPGDCSFAGGSAIWIYGGMVSATGTSVLPPTILSNDIHNNVQSGTEGAGGDGGAGIALWGGNAVVENNTIHGNLTHGIGGGISIENADAAIVIQNLVYGNEAGGGGGGLATNGGTLAPANRMIANNTFADNTYGPGLGRSTADESVSQIYFWAGGGPSISFVNNIVSGNTTDPAIACGTANSHTGADDTTFDHNLFFNSGGPVFAFCQDPTGTYGNLTANPQFQVLAPGVGPLYDLTAGSPAVDAGNNSVNALLKNNGFDPPIAPTADIDNAPRPSDATGKGYPIIDIGSYEFAGTQNANATTILLTPAVYSVDAGDPITLTANLFSANGIPTGSVTFTDNGTTIGTTNLDATGTATIPAPLTPGVHHLVAIYPGQGVFTPAVSIQVIVVVSSYTTIMTVTSSPNPSILGSPVLFTVTVISPDNDFVSPIILTNGFNGPVLATLTPDATGTATYTTSSLPIGDNFIVASYAGDATHDADSAHVIQTVLAAPATTTALTCTPGSIALGSTSQCSINVSSTSSTPAGSVSILDNGANLATVTLIAGSATYTYTGTSAGSHIITASYPTTATFNGSSATATIVVGDLPTTSALSITPNPAVYGAAVTLTATVAPVTPLASPVPTGSVSFYGLYPNTSLAVLIGTATLSNSVATFKTATLPAGLSTITCTYSGDSTFNSSNCAPGGVTILNTLPGVYPTTLTLTSSNNPSAANSPITFTATLTSVGQPVSNATISLSFNSQQISLTSDATGSVTYNSPGLAPGSYNFTANFAGGFITTLTGTLPYGPSSASLTETVAAPTQDFTLTATPPSITIQTQHHASLPLTLTSIGGFTGLITFACAGTLPPYLTCEFPPTTLAVNAKQSVTLTMDTDAVLNFYAANSTPAAPHSHLLTALACLLPFTLFPLAARRRKLKRLGSLGSLICLAAIASGLTACTGYYPPSTPPGTYIVPVTATGTSIGNSAPVTHTLNITLTVTH